MLCLALKILLGLVAAEALTLLVYGLSFDVKRFMEWRKKNSESGYEVCRTGRMGSIGDWFDKEEAMFLKGLLFGLGWILGTGIAVTIILGFLFLSHIAQEFAAKMMPVKRAAEKHKQTTGRHQAKLFLVIRLPATAEERLELRKRGVQYLQ